MQTIFQIYRLSWMSCENLSQKISFILNNLTGVMRGFFEFLVPLFTSYFVKAIQDGNKEDILFYFYLVIGSSFFEIFVSRVNVYFNEYLRYVLRLSLKKIYYRKLFNKPYSWHLHNSSGYFLSMLNNVAAILSQFIIKTTHGYINNFTIAILFIIYAFYKSFYLGLYFTVGMTGSIIYSYISYYLRLPLTNEWRDSHNQFEKSYTDLLYNIKTVKKTNLLSFVFQVLNGKYDKHLNAGKRIRYYIAYQTIISKLYLLLLFALPTGYFLYQYVETGEHLATIVMLVSIYPMLKNINNEFMNIAEDINDAKAHIDNLTKNFDDKDEELLQKPAGKNIKHWHKFVFKDVSFTYYKKHS
ncbi:MAG: ABC transporter transmembrane domain-containing protein, partial [Alphaproteobacteria bacterium]